VVLVTHELSSILRIADRCLLLDREVGRVVAIGDPRVLQHSEEPRVHDFFNPGSIPKERSWRPAPTM
jgi:phospholipid/cholesterol/gamma-HCH transport system ATP-binding protein